MMGISVRALHVPRPVDPVWRAESPVLEGVSRLEPGRGLCYPNSSMEDVPVKMRMTCVAVSVLLMGVAMGGCARAARDTTGFAVVETATVNADMPATWQAAKAALRELDLDIYTRDKRGTFVAYDESKFRFWVLTPKRTQYTITLDRVASETTKVTVETIRQVYGSTLLTYPDWHDRKAEDSGQAKEILAALQGKLS